MNVHVVVVKVWNSARSLPSDVLRNNYTAVTLGSVLPFIRG